MKTIKPKPLPKRLRTTLERMAAGEYHAIDEEDASSILAALEHARQQSEAPVECGCVLHRVRKP